MIMVGKLRWTGQTATYAVGSVLALFLGGFLGAPLLSLAGGIMAIVIALDALWIQLGEPAIRMEVQPLRAPEKSNVTVRVDTHRLQPHHHLHVPLTPGLRLYDARKPNVFVPNRNETQHEFTVTAMVRGPQRIGPVTLRSWSPVRLWVQDQVLSQEETVEVVPHAAEIDSVGLLSRVVKPMQGRFTVNRPGQGFDFFTLRQYASGDTMRDVNWKASARGEELIVNQRQMETHSEIMILVDSRTVSGVGPAGRTPLDRSCRVALGLFADGVASRDTVRFLAYGKGVESVDTSRGEGVTILENVLARLPPDGEVGLKQAWMQVKTEMKSSGPIMILTSGECDSSMTAAVADMVGRGHPVTVLSPTPIESKWMDIDPRTRRFARQAMLKELRDRGAIVVDWGPEKPLMAERPTIGVFA